MTAPEAGSLPAPARSDLLWWGGAGCLLAYVYLGINSQFYGQAGVWQLLAVTLICTGVVTILWWLHWRRSLRLVVWPILFFAVAFRVVGVFSYPLLEDDHFRYLWDGFMWVEYGSPYGVAPAEFFAADAASLSARFSEILDGINYPHVPTVYGPVAQWLFALGYLIAPGQVWPLQLVSALADLGIVLLLWRMAPLHLCLLYAWCPLLVKEYAFTAHIDVVGAALMLLAFFVALRKHLVAAGVLLALAAGIKPFALLAAPFVLGWRWPGWLALVAGGLVISLPFIGVPAIATNGTPGTVNLMVWFTSALGVWTPEGLRVMADSWLFNAPLYLAWLELFSVETLATLKSVLVVMFVVLWLSLSAHSIRQQRGGGVPEVMPLICVFGLLLLTLPVLNPWYLVWWLVFASLQPALTPWVAAFAVTLSYLTGLNLGDPGLQLYEQPGWVLLLEFGLIAVAVLIDLHNRGWLRLRRPAGSI